MDLNQNLPLDSRNSHLPASQFRMELAVEFLQHSLHRGSSNLRSSELQLLFQIFLRSLWLNSLILILEQFFQLSMQRQQPINRLQAKPAEPVVLILQGNLLQQDLLPQRQLRQESEWIYKRKMNRPRKLELK